MCVSASKQYWAGDFWLHSAAVHELAYNPLHPKNPVLSLDAPNPDFSPYIMAWSLFSRVTQKSAIGTLSVAAAFNILLFLAGLYLFISAIAPRERDGVAFYSLLFILLLWGSSAWNWSGFFHLRVLGYVLPYPSTFCVALSFFALAFNKWRIDQQREFWLAPILLICVIVLLSHPFTFIFLASGLVAMMFSTKRRLISECIRIGGLFLATLLLAALWPYYPFLKFVFFESGVYDNTQAGMYNAVLIRIWPVLIGIPLLLLDFRSNWRQPIPLMFAILLTVYVLAGMIKSYSYGRVLPFMVILIDITIAIHLVKLENKLEARGAGSLNQPLLISAAVTLIMVSYGYTLFIKPALDRSILSPRKSYENYTFLSKYVEHYDPILAAPRFSGMLPTFGGKVVGAGYDTPFVTDAKTRLQDADRFFDVKTTQEDRIKIIQKYGVKYIMLEKTKASNWEIFREKMRGLGDIVYQNRRYVLYSVNLR
jgi:hypothetical protein